MTSSSLNKNKEHDRSKSVSSIDDLAAKVDQLLKGNQSQVFIMEETAPEKSAGDLAFDAEISGDEQQEVFWPKQDKLADPAQSNQGQYARYQKNYQPQNYVLSQPQNNPPQMQKHQNTQPATSAPVVVPQDETKAMLQQLLQGQHLQGKALNQVTTEINTRMNHMFSDLSTKYENVASHMRQMDIQIAQTAESVKRQQGTLPGKTDKNPKVCNAVELRSGKQLSEPVKKRFTAAEKGKQKESEQPTADAPAAEKEREPTVGTNSPGLEQPAETVRPIPGPVPAREYTLKVPYPVPAKATRKDREEMKCRKMLEDLTVRLPLIDAIQMMPSMSSFMKGLISGKISEESEFMTVSKECSAVLQNRQIKKRGDPGKFVLSIQIGKTIFSCSLVDLGSSVNLMPYSVARHHKSPVGILEDLQVKVGNISVPADFEVLELEEESKDPLTLGRSFLCTVGAIIDVRQGKIDLHLGDIVMQFEMDELLKKPMLDGQTFEVDEGIDPLQPPEGMIEEILTEDPLELALVRAEAKLSVENIDADGYAKMLDSVRSMGRMVASLSLREESYKDENTPTRATPLPNSPVPPNQPDDPWIELKAPKVELKSLPKGLRYAFLGLNSTYPVIVNDELNNMETALPLCELRKYRKALGYSLADIPGFFQIPIHPDDQEKTTFTCPYGTYAYRRMPFGLCNAPATFQRCMMSIFTDLIEDIMEVFIDDFSVYGSSFSVYLSNLCRVLKTCEEKHLVLNWEKCHFMVRDGIVLGHKISEKGIEVDKEKIEVMMSLQPPPTVKAIRSFLGRAGFYRRFIQDFSKIARPLTRLLCKEIKFDFDIECLAAFHTIKGALVSAPVVQPPDWDLPFEVMTDASDFAVGAVLGQRKDKKLHVIYYARKTMDETQCRYATTEKELLAIVFAFEKFISYLVGSKVIVHTDHATLKYLLTKKDAKPRMKIEDDSSLDEEHTVEHVNAIGLRFAEQPLSITSDCSRVPEQPVAVIQKQYSHLPWFAVIANFLAAEKEPLKFTGNEKRKFLREARQYVWDEPYLYKHCKDGIFRRCVPEADIPGILHHYARHFATFKTVSRILQAGFWWPTMFRDAHAYIARCDAYQ
ncbi:uncharacterized protein LOC106432247 [Brassica napus]|uniref:uncharacterized protein LOC106432247 n=1 Tax=Brassica napus TaxID=3708 RepID=UPI0006AA8337|nr:uncharacterized protein LOC106432247 [Brassica napus]